MRGGVAPAFTETDPLSGDGGDVVLSERAKHSVRYRPDHTRLTFKLRQCIKWHDGKPFIAADVKCTWDLLLGKSPDKLRLNPRKAWYRNLEDIVPGGDHAVTFVLKRSQSAIAHTPTA